MGWNGSNNGSGAVVKDEGRKPSAKAAPSFKKGIIAGLVVVLGAGLAAWWIGRPGTSAPAKEKKTATKQIAEVKPQIVTQAVEVAEQKVEKPKPVDPKARPTKVGEVVNGYVMLPSGRIHKRTGVVSNSVSERPRARYAIFERDCNNQIAGLLTIKPGDLIVGTPNYNGRFKKDFVASLNEPIVITEDDTPQQAQLKRDVIAARLELKDAMDRGEDIEQIMLDTRAELQDMMRYKSDLRKQFLELNKGENMTEQDADDVFAACNKMLEERGIAPLTYGPITRRNLMRQQAAESSKVQD